MMRKYVTILVLAILISACKNENSNTNGVKVTDIHNPASAEKSLEEKAKAALPILTFEKTTHDFGKVLQGEKLSYTFKFKNTGKSNLIIDKAESSCGCTTTTPPKAPIRPGETGEIRVVFDSKTKQGESTNIVAISANTYPVLTILTLKANVIIP